jgi:hypothetical protein
MLRKVNGGFYCIYLVYLAMPLVRQLVTNFLPWRPGFSSRVAHVGLVVDRVALGQVFVQALQLSPANFRSASDPYPFLIRGWYSGPI